jgi:hypothetical protein
MGVQSFYLNKLMLCRLQRLYAGVYFNRLGAPIVHCLLIRGLFTTPCPLFRLSAPIVQCTLTSLLRGYLLHMCYHVLRCGSREYPTFHYSLAHPLFLVVRVCRCAAARYGCACTVAVLDNRSGFALGLGCGVDASGRRFGFARPAWPAAWRSCALRVALLSAAAVAVVVSSASLLGILLLVGRLVRVCSLWLVLWPL